MVSSAASFPFPFPATVLQIVGAQRRLVRPRASGAEAAPARQQQDVEPTSGMLLPGPHAFFCAQPFRGGLRQGLVGLAA